jgi:hypothetical protein
MRLGREMLDLVDDLINHLSCKDVEGFADFSCTTSDSLSSSVSQGQRCMRPFFCCTFINRDGKVSLSGP